MQTMTSLLVTIERSRRRRASSPHARVACRPALLAHLKQSPRSRPLWTVSRTRASRLLLAPRRRGCTIVRVLLPLCGASGVLVSSPSQERQCRAVRACTWFEMCRGERVSQESRAVRGQSERACAISETTCAVRGGKSRFASSCVALVVCPETGESRVARGAECRLQPTSAP